MRLSFFRLAALSIAAVLGRAEIIDQVAATVDNQVITASQIMEEIRVTAFLNGEQPDFSAANRRKTADRLIEQLLVVREMQLTRFPQPDRTAIEQTLAQIKARLGSQAAYKKALSDDGLTEAQLVDALMRQAALLQFIDLRFRPEIQVQEQDVLQYYENVYLPELRRRGVTPEPAFEDVQDLCEKALVAQLVDRRVDLWLRDARSRTRIRYEEDAFQ